MKYDKIYLDIKIGLIKSLLIELPSHVLDISYTVESGQLITVQVVLIEGTALEPDVKSKTLKNLSNFEVEFKFVYISKERFNMNSGNWTPTDFSWLDNLLFSKAEQL